MNTLINEECSIVSNIPGTTRDSIKSYFFLEGIKFCIIDTAGIRNTNNEIEKIGIKNTYKNIKKSIIILYLFDSLTFNQKNIKKINFLQLKYPNKQFIIIANKSDICSVILKKNLFKNFLFISAKKKIGINQLKLKIIDIVNNNILKSEILQYHINNRHYNLLKKSLISIDSIHKGLKNNLPSDLISIDIRNCICYLGEITGKITTDDILNNIFKNFCIGK